MGGVQIRPALPAELPAIGELRVAAYQADGFLTAESGYAPTLRALGADGGGEVLAAVDGTGLVGTVMLQPWPYAGEVVRAAGEAEMRALAVAPHARGRGIGAALVAAVTERAQTLGIRDLLLLTRPDMLAAHRLYARAGFRRLPDRDWSPHPGLLLLAYGRELGP
jgi:ribosomal protein S18 acetylase RimI-like enzyme